MIVLIGDIINSRRLHDRAKVQERFHFALDQVNNKCAGQLVSIFTITHGDEFQGALKQGIGLLGIIDGISLALLPIKLRYGIGIGEVTTKIDPTNSYTADGPAFWKAREAIDYVHDHSDYRKSNIHLCSQYPDDTVNLINQILKLTAHQVSGWRKSQFEVLEGILEEGISDPNLIPHKKIAEKLGISPSALTRRLESSGIKRYLYAYRDAEIAIEKINSHLTE